MDAIAFRRRGSARPKPNLYTRVWFSLIISLANIFSYRQVVFLFCRFRTHYGHPLFLPYKTFSSSVDCHISPEPSILIYLVTVVLKNEVQEMKIGGMEFQKDKSEQWLPQFSKELMSRTHELILLLPPKTLVQ